jgi:hypothetical protein
MKLLVIRTGGKHGKLMYYLQTGFESSPSCMEAQAKLALFLL